MPSRAPARRTAPLPTIATRVQTPHISSTMRPWVPLHLFHPIAVVFGVPTRTEHTKGTITPTPWSDVAQTPVTIRSERCSIRSHQATSMRCFLRSLRALNSTACWRTSGSGRSTVRGPRWHQLLFVPSHSLPQLSHPSAQQWPNPLLSCRHHPGDCVPWTRPGHCLAPGVHHATRWAYQTGL